MKALGYVIYFFWDFKHAQGDEEWQTSTTQPMIEFKKKVYATKAVAEEAIAQMKKLDNPDNASYHILPIFTPLEEYNEVLGAYMNRISKKENNGKEF